MKTVKITIEGESEAVEIICRVVREFLNVSEEGKTQPLPLRGKLQVRRSLRVVAPLWETKSS